MAKSSKPGSSDAVVVPLKRRPRARQMEISEDAPTAAVAFAQKHLFSPNEPVGPMPKGSPRLSLEKVIQALHDSEINVGPQTFYDCGLQVWIGDELNGLQAKASMEADRDGRWRGDGAVALWLHRTALRLFPESGYARRHGGRRAAALRIG